MSQGLKLCGCSFALGKVYYSPSRSYATSPILFSNLRIHYSCVSPSVCKPHRMPLPQDKGPLDLEMPSTRTKPPTPRPPLCAHCSLFTCFSSTLRAGSLSVSCVHMLLAVLLRRSMPKTRTFAFRIDVSRPTLPVEGCELCICATSKRADSVSKAFELLMLAAVSWTSR